MSLDKNVRKMRLGIHAVVILVAVTLVDHYTTSLIPPGVSTFFAFVASVAACVSILTRFNLLVSQGYSWAVWGDGEKKKFPQGWHVIWVYISTLASVGTFIHTKAEGIPLLSPVWWESHYFHGIVFVLAWAWLIAVAIKIQFRNTALEKLTVRDILRASKLVNKVRKEFEAEITRLNEVVVKRNQSELELEDQINNLNARVDELKTEVQNQADEVNRLNALPKPRERDKPPGVSRASKSEKV